MPADSPRPGEKRWLKRASPSLEVEADDIALDSPEATQRLLDTIAHAVELLAEHRGLGGPGRIDGTRELVVPDTPYPVPYRVGGNAVERSIICHGCGQSQ